MEKDILGQFNLPAYLKGKSFADASKLVEKKFTDRNDKVSMETKQDLLGRLSEAQEYLKMQEGLKNESQQIPDQMDGDIPAGMEQFSGGGAFGDPIAPVGEEAFGPTSEVGEGEGVDVAGYASMGAGALDMGRELFGDTGVDTSGAQKYDKVDGAGAALSGVAKGAKLGMVAGPWGAAAGALVGGVSSLIGAGRKNKEITEANAKANVADNAKIRQSDFKLGGSMDNKYVKGGPFEIDPLAFDGFGQGIPAKISKPMRSRKEAENLFKAPNFAPTVAKPLATPERPEFEPTMVGKGLDWLGKNAGNIAQYAPVASNLLELKNLKRAVTPRGTRVEGGYKPKRFDEAQMLNQVNQQNIERSLTESSGGDIGALRTNLIGAGAAKLKAQSQAQAKGQDVNRAEDKMAFQANRQKDIVNTRLDRDFLNRAAQDKGMYETTKSDLKRALAEDVGAIGREEVDKKLVKELFGYKWNGKYYTDEKGKKVASSVVRAKLKDAQAKSKDTE